MSKILITGGCGFIGVNAAKRYLDEGNQVIIVDNLSRRGSDINLKWLESQKPNFEFHKIDICDFTKLNKLVKNNSDIDLVLHLAAQVAVTTSVVSPREDFEINALGTLNVLESMRLNSSKAVLIYSSTNKVYGKTENIKIAEKNNRYCYEDLPEGINESFNLDFYSPYGCSKGAADQYVRDYHRIYGLKTVVFRQSCIYGTNQFGIEDQGWVAHFAIQSILSRPITIYGDGKQVRDVLYVDDLLDAFNLAYKNIGTSDGQVYNIGGGRDNQMSLLELIRYLEESLGKKLELKFDSWRPGDQKVFVSNNTKLLKELNWKPKNEISEGLTLLIDWVKNNKNLFL
jgi:CDP-paratose 2-epimerase